MIEIDSFRPPDFDVIKGFVEAIQEHESVNVPELKPSMQIGSAYTKMLLSTVAEKNGAILVARAGVEAIGFVCAWIEEDDDTLLLDEARLHGYVSDMFVCESWRRRGVARQLMNAIEAEMIKRGCKRMRICTKATNPAAVGCYQANGYRPYEIILSKSLTG
jgi:ribosomal protein S18 acetylase RimI-like enzyme